MATDGFEKVKKLASEALTGISDTVSDLGSTVDTQRQIRTLQKKIADVVKDRDQVMLEIGRKVYALHGLGKVRNADIVPLCEKIEVLSADVTSLNEQVQDLSRPKPKGTLEPIEVDDDTELTGEDSIAEEPDDEYIGEPAEEPAEAPAEEPVAEATEESETDDE